MAHATFPPRLHQALRVAARPDLHDCHPERRLIAWAILKTARGQSIRQHRLRAMAGRPRRLEAPGQDIPEGAV